MSTLVVTNDKNNGNVELAVGDMLELHLTENPTTGYRWKLSNLDDTFLRVLDSRYLVEGPTPGEAGIRRLILEILKPGQATLDARNMREWEGESSAIDRFHLTVMAK